MVQAKMDNFQLDVINMAKALKSRFEDAMFRLMTGFGRMRI